MKEVQCLQIFPTRIHFVAPFLHVTYFGVFLSMTDFLIFFGQIMGPTVGMQGV